MVLDSSVDAVGLFPSSRSDSYGSKGCGTSLYSSDQLVSSICA
jgi:hypothetical protein